MCWLVLGFLRIFQMCICTFAFIVLIFLFWAFTIHRRIYICFVNVFNTLMWIPKKIFEQQKHILECVCASFRWFSSSVVRFDSPSLIGWDKGWSFLPANECKKCTEICFQTNVHSWLIGYFVAEKKQHLAKIYRTHMRLFDGNSLCSFICFFLLSFMCLCARVYSVRFGFVWFVVTTSTERILHTMQTSKRTSELRVQSYKYQDITHKIFFRLEAFMRMWAFMISSGIFCPKLHYPNR